MTKHFIKKLKIHIGCIPVDENQEFVKVNICGKTLSGKKYLEELDRVCREGYFNKTDPERKERAIDYMWYLWCGPYSPLFGKDAMKTFERYFTNDKALHKEVKNPYYSFYEDINFIHKIFKEFGLNPEISHIVNGHVPVKEKKGESPIKADGKLIVIDGGFSKAYQSETGLAGYTLIYNSYGHVPVKEKKGESPIKADGKLIVIDGGFSKAYQSETGLAGYTLIYNSYGLKLVSHEPFQDVKSAIEKCMDIDGGFSKAYQSETGLAGYTLIYNSYGLKLVSHEPFQDVKSAIEKCMDIHSSTRIVKRVLQRKRVKDTDIGTKLQEQIDDLYDLLNAYKQGFIKEKH